MIKIGQKEVVFSETIILGCDIAAELEFVVDAWPVKLVICFQDTEGDSPAVGYGRLPDSFRIDFQRWKDSTGTILSPIEFARTPQGRKLTVEFFHQLIGKVNRVTVQVLAEVPNAG